jgi:hypothetical protein
MVEIFFAPRIFASLRQFQPTTDDHTPSLKRLSLLMSKVIAQGFNSEEVNCWRQVQWSL